jgi:hemerythrin-like domain-containing protein
MRVSESLRRQIQHEHNTLRLLEEDMLDRCEEFCNAPDAAHLGQVKRLFDDFANSLERHFEFEEVGGYLKIVTDKRPHHSAAVEKLLADHKELMALISVIKEDLRQDVVENGECLRKFKEDFVALMKKFDRHEVAERELLMDVFWLEGGNSE